MKAYSSALALTSPLGQRPGPNYRQNLPRAHDAAGPNLDMYYERVRLLNEHEQLAVSHIDVCLLLCRSQFAAAPTTVPKTPAANTI